MAIKIVKGYDTHSEMVEAMEKFHKALEGSPAYVKGEINLVENNDTSFVLVVGNYNGRDIIVF